MKPEGQDRLIRFRSGLARVRWDNVALLALALLALAAVTMSGKLAGHGSSQLPADVGLSGDPATREAQVPPQRHRGRASEPRRERVRKRHRRGTSRARRDHSRDPAPTRSPPAPGTGSRPSPPPLPAGAGGEFAPD